MDKNAYIKQVANLFQKHAPKYGIRCVSVPVAQFCKESAFGTSELAVKVNNYAGIKLKFKANGTPRTPIAIGGYNKASGEFYDGNYVTPVSEFAIFLNLEDCVIGYLQFITSSSTYAGLQGLTDPKRYCELIAPYATSPTYSKSLWNDYIVKYNLTQYDIFKEEERKMVINVHAGHNPEGKVASGAAKYLNESRENRKVKDLVIKYLREQGHTVFDCTCDNGTSVSDVLNKIIEKCNAHTVDLDVSIHFNAGTTDTNSLTTGTEVLVYSTSSKSVQYAKATVNAIAELGFMNRGVKTRTDLAFLRRTKAPAMLIECCFVDDKDDANLYDPDEMARAIVKGITGQAVEENTTTEQPFIICPHCGQTIYL